jgi:hypothetical protein
MVTVHSITEILPLRVPTRSLSKEGAAFWGALHKTEANDLTKASASLITKRHLVFLVKSKS